MCQPGGGPGTRKDPRDNAEPGGRRMKRVTKGPVILKGSFLIMGRWGVNYGKWGERREKKSLRLGFCMTLSLYGYFRPDQCCFLFIKPLSNMSQKA